jgi:hypothetical protein
MALIVRPDATAPRAIDFGNATTLEQKVNESSRALFGRHSSDDRGIRLRPDITREGDPLQLYQAVWQPLESSLSGVKRLFLSPDGVLNTISFVAIPISQEARILDVLDLRTVTSTRELLHQEQVTGARH